MASGKKIILDVDTGTDDAQAIMMALSRPEVDLIAITCVSGNVEVDQVAVNTLRVLEVCGRLDVPVYKGPLKSIVSQDREDSRFHHGSDGMGGVQHPSTPDLSIIKSTPAPMEIRELVNKYPGEITLVAVGPLTNVALALRLDEKLGSKLKDFIVMGGNIHARGRVTTSAEHNFFIDPEAASIVLSDMELPIKLLPYEIALNMKFSWDWFNSLMSVQTPKGQFHRAINEFSANRKINLMKLPNFYACDPVAMAIAIDNSVLKEMDRKYCAVELRGELTRGQMVVDWNGVLRKEPNVGIITKVDLSIIKTFYEEMLK